MSAAEPTLIECGGGTRRFSDVLAALGRDGPPDLTVNELVHAFGDRAFGAIMLVVALINLLPLPPGGTTLTGAPLLLLSLELAWGRDRLWLPGWALRGSVSRSGYARAVRGFLPTIRLAERLSRPRLSWLVSPFSLGFVGLMCLALSVVLVLPIWLGNLAPAAAIALFSLGIMQRDGLAILAGWLASALSIALLIFAWGVIWRMAEGAWASASDWVMQMAATLGAMIG